MLAVGMLLVWGGYSVSLWGWCLLRGYDVTLGQLMSPVHPYGDGKGQTWPPPLMGSDQIFPGGRSPSGSVGGSGASSGASSAAPGSRIGGAAQGLPAPSGRLGPGGTVPK